MVPKLILDDSVFFLCVPCARGGCALYSKHLFSYESSRDAMHGNSHPIEVSMVFTRYTVGFVAVLSGTCRILQI